MADEGGEGSSSKSKRDTTCSLFGVPLQKIRILTNSALKFHESTVRVLIKKNIPVESRKPDDILGVGSAFILHVGQERVLCLTADHTFEKKEKDDIVFIRFSGQGTDYPVDIKYQDKDRDLCILVVKVKDLDLPFNLKSLDFSTDPIANDTNIVVLGYSHVKLELPSHGDLHIREPYELVPVKKATPLVGQLRNTHEEKELPYREVLKYDVMTIRGFSGAPVIVEDKVVGVHLGTVGRQRDGVSNKTVMSVLKSWLQGDNDDKASIEVLARKLDEQIGQHAID